MNLERQTGFWSERDKPCLGAGNCPTGNEEPLQVYRVSRKVTWSNTHF